MKINHHYIKRMLFSYLPILFVTIGLLIFIFISIMNQLNIRNVIQANRLTAEYVANMVDRSLKGISLSAQQSIESGGVVQQYLDNPPDGALDFDVSNLLSNLIVRFELIDSIYLYRAKDGIVLDQSTIRSIAQFPDRSYIQHLLDQTYSGVWSSPRTKNTEELGITSSYSVTSLGFRIPRDSGSLGYLIINVKTSSLHSFIDQMIDRKITEAQIFDSQGKSFYDEGRKISDRNRPSADIESDYTGWTYQIGIKGGELFDFLFHGSTVWVLLGLGAIIFAIGSTFYVTRRSYKPIESILHRIERFSSTAKSVTDPNKNENEFAFIDQAIERLITNNMSFQEQQQENLAIRRQQFLQMLLKGEYHGDRVASWEQEWQHFGLEAGHFVVALLELDNYVQFGLKYSPGDQSLFKFIISSVTQELAEQYGQRIVAEWIAKNQFAILLTSEDSGSMEYRLLQLSEQIRSWVELHLDFTVTIGIGTAADDEFAISRSFNEAFEAVSRKVSFGLNQIIDAVEVRGKREGEWYTYPEAIHTIVRQLRMSEQAWKSGLKQLYVDMAVRCLRKEDVNHQLRYLIFHLEYELEGSLTEATGLWTQDIKPALFAVMERSDTLQQLEEGFLAMLGQLSSHIEDLSQNRRYDTLMREVRDYAAEHFMDPNLSLTLLSDRFQISSKYLSQLFKESIGQNFSDYLISLRIEYAKRILCETDVTVQEISDRMGYANPTSFIRVFKKVVGLSPGQYRDRTNE